MSADTYENRTSQDPAHEEEWASDEAGAAQRETMDEGFRAAREEEEPVGSESEVAGPESESEFEREPDQDLGASAQAARTPYAAPAVEGHGDSARPEDLGGRNSNVGDEPPLVAIEAQEEFLSRWSRIQVSFLEDPSGAVESAETLITDINTAIRASLEERSGELTAEARAAADTEQRRLALRRYRAFIGVVLPKQSITGE
jgi:hypothetical protein